MDFRGILDVNPDANFTCVGITKQYLRCRNAINRADRSRASELLSCMGNLDIHDAAFLDQVERLLRELAEHTLCLRWHRHRLPQGPDVSNRWYAIVAGHQARLLAAEPRPVESPPRRIQQLLTPPPSPSPVYRDPQTPRVGTARTVIESRPAAGGPRQIAYIAEARNQHIHQPIIFNTTPPRNRRLTTPITPDTTPNPTPATTPLPRNNAPIETVHRTPTRNAQAPPQTIPVLLPPAPIAHPMQTRLRTQVARRPIFPADDCPICLDPITLTTATWCRAMCGQNMHRTCFGFWRNTCLSSYRHVTCPFCRTPWIRSVDDN